MLTTLKIYIRYSYNILYYFIIFYIISMIVLVIIFIPYYSIQNS